MSEYLLDAAASPGTGAVTVLPGIMRQYGVLLFQSAIGFGISRQFRLFLIANVIVALLAAYFAARLMIRLNLGI
jgi:hypothetical protein